MTKYFLDTNFILRFLLRDNVTQFNKTKNILRKIAGRKTKAKLITEVVMEVEYVLRKFYKVPRSVIAQKLLQIVNFELVDVEKKNLLIKTLENYADINMDLVDLLLFFQAAAEKGKILTFDKDFKKLNKILKMGDKGS